MSQNFEELYNKLKEEFESSKKDNDEICKEYESTIEMLTESVENFKKEKETLEKKLSKLEQEQKNFTKEKENLMNKNNDKIIDIQNLNKQNDRLIKEVKKLKEEKNLFDTKIVSLENDNEHFQNKVREYEVLTEDLENQLETALEENITLQTEFETYKQTVGDELLRKDDEIREIKNDLNNKEKIIQKMERLNNAIFVKNIQKDFKEEENVNATRRRRFTILPGAGGRGNMALKAFERKLSSNIDKKDESSDVSIKQTKTFKEMNNNLNNNMRARNSVFVSGFGNLSRLVKQKEELNKKVIIEETNKKENKMNKDKDKEKLNKSFLNNKSILAEEKIDEKSEKSESSDSETEKKEEEKEKEKEKKFNNLKICPEKKFDLTSIENNNNNKNNGTIPPFRISGNEQAIIEKLQNILLRIQKRKVLLIDKRNANRERMKKLKQN